MTTLLRLCDRPHNRTLTVQPRRYRDKKTGVWKDAKSLRPTDIPSLLLALDAAMQFVAQTPLPGQPVDDEREIDTLEDGELPADSPAL